MAATGVIPFVRGVDFSRNDFSGDLFPSEMADMSGLRWLKINRTNLDRVPEQLSHLKHLEHLQMIRNNLASVHGELSDLPMLRSIIVRHNQVKTSGIPEDIFDKMIDLTIVDFSHNQLREVPANLDHARSSIVLNLSYNHLEQIPNQLFVNMTDLIYLDLSHNKLEMLPPQMRRLLDLQVLILNNNPLQHFQLKQVTAMGLLRVLHMRSTQLSPANIPPGLDGLANLEDVDFSCNDLAEIPDALFKLRRLRRLNLSDNQIERVPTSYQECWPNMELLNLSRNKLKDLPNFICGLVKLRKLFVNNNYLDFEGLPAGLGRLVNLEVFHASHNNLELVPEGLCRCVKLKKIKLNNNRLVTLPDSIHLLPDLMDIDVKNNPDLVMPPKPSEMQKGAGLAFYNIDFSLDHQLKVAGHSPSSSMSSSPTPTRDPVARKIQFLKRRKGQASEADTDQRKILKGMSDVAKERTRAEEAMAQNLNLKPKRWDEALEKPPLDYSEFFEESIGQDPGLTVWEIENFLPNQLDEAFHGKFYEGDCYIILRTYFTDSHSLDWKIYYWIGEKATLDKKACAAIHAVNLRNFLGAHCRTIREEMNDESDEFMELFDDEIDYIEGGRTLSGFYTVENIDIPTRLYRISPKGSHIHLEPVQVCPDSLDPRFVFLLDTGKTMFVWYGKKSKGVVRSKTRLFADKVNKNERKSEVEIEMCHQGQESPGFWRTILGFDGLPDDPIVEHVSEDFQPSRPLLYHVCLGMGYLELPQVEYKPGQLKQDLLQARGVYILDCHTDLFVWIGKKSTRLVRAAGIKLATELQAMLNRPLYAITHRVCEGTEPLLFKTKFFNWDDVIAVDFTRTAESVQRRGVDLNTILERDKIKTDLTALFLERQLVMNDDDAEQLMEECNEDLELIEPFVLEGRKFVRLPEHEFGSFYTTDCYVFLCRYWMPPDDDPEVDENGEASERPEAADPPQDDFQCVVYFWQGRDASNMGWLTFTFSLQKKFEALFKDKLEVVRMYQQQENHKFLSHFKKRFLIKRGRRNLMNFPGARRWPEFYHLRANGSPICTRTIQIECDSSQLNSEFCYVLKTYFQVPEDDGSRGRLYVWIGSKTSPKEAILAEEMSRDPKGALNKDGFPVEVIQEGAEPELFWTTLGGKKPYEIEADFMRFSRLFRCTNEKGYFCVSEKTIDFCQDDLDDGDIMILDNGDQIFLWVGSKASEVEVKLAYKSAQVYIQHLRLKQPNRPRKLVCTLRGKESKRFTKCFHAWGKHKNPLE